MARQKKSKRVLFAGLEPSILVIYSTTDFVAVSVVVSSVVLVEMNCWLWVLLIYIGLHSGTAPLAATQASYEYIRERVTALRQRISAMGL